MFLTNKRRRVLNGERINHTTNISMIQFHARINKFTPFFPVHKRQFRSTYAILNFEIVKYVSAKFGIAKKKRWIFSQFHVRTYEYLNVILQDRRKWKFTPLSRRQFAVTVAFFFSNVFSSSLALTYVRFSFFHKFIAIREYKYTIVSFTIYVTAIEVRKKVAKGKNNGLPRRMVVVGWSENTAATVRKRMQVIYTTDRQPARGMNWSVAKMCSRIRVEKNCSRLLLKCISR